MASLEDSIKKIAIHEFQHFLDSIRPLPGQVGIEHAATSAEGSTLNLLIRLLLGAIVMLCIVIGIVAWIFLNRSAKKETREREIEDAREKRRIERDDKLEAERIAEKKQDREDQLLRDQLARDDRQRESDERERREERYERQREAARGEVKQEIKGGLGAIRGEVVRNAGDIGGIRNDITILDKRLAVVEAKQEK